MKILTGNARVFLFAALVAANSASAGLVTFNFTGAVASISGTPFGINVSLGQQVQGSFTYDTSLAPAFDTGSVAGYIQPPPSGMSVVISNVTLQSQNYNSFQVVNDAFGGDNINGYFTPITANGVLKSGSISFSLTDPTFTALSSTALPSALNFASFSQRVGNVYDAATGGALAFSIDLPAITVKIDVKPGEFPNAIPPRSKSLVSVAVLSTEPADNTTTFDATTVDPTTVTFGATGTEVAATRYEFEDVDGDGDIDLVLQFPVNATGIKCGDTSVSLLGKTINGVNIKGSDTIKTTGCK